MRVEGGEIVRAIILAAGMGMRISSLIIDAPKALIKVGARTVLEHQMESLKTAGIDKVTMVVGFKGDAIKRFYMEHSWDVDFVDNWEYASTNNFFSLWMASDRFGEGFVCLNSDVLFDIGILEDLLGCGEDICAAVGPSTLELVKVKLDGGKIAKVNKTMWAWDSCWVGMVKFSQSGVEQLLSVFESIPKGELKAMILSEGAQKLIDGGYPVHISDARERQWINIDSARDLVYARSRRW